MISWFILVYYAYLFVCCKFGFFYLFLVYTLYRFSTIHFVRYVQLLELDVVAAVAIIFWCRSCFGWWPWWCCRCFWFWCRLARRHCAEQQSSSANAWLPFDSWCDCCCCPDATAFWRFFAAFLLHTDLTHRLRSHFITES